MSVEAGAYLNVFKVLIVRDSIYDCDTGLVGVLEEVRVLEFQVGLELLVRLPGRNKLVEYVVVTLALLRHIDGAVYMG